MRRSLLLALLLVAGCVTANPPADGTGAVSDRVMGWDSKGIYHSTQDQRGRDMVLPVAAAKVREPILAAYDALGLELNVIDPPNGVYAASDIVKSRLIGGSMISNFLSCGDGFSGPRANTDRIHLSVQTTVKADTAGGSSVMTNLTAMAQNSEGTSSNAAPCTTTGALEARINASIKARLLLQ